MIDEASGTPGLRSLWPLDILANVKIGDVFDESTAKRRGLVRNVEHERELEFENEVWDSNDGDLSIAVCDGLIVGVSSHEDVTVHGIQLMGLSLEELIETFGEPNSIGTTNGVGSCDYEEGAWGLTVGLWEDVVSWASLTNYTYLDE